jgi:glutamine amidotransferase
MITIVDYGMGNLGSIQNMLNKIGTESIITNDLEKIYQAEKIILPGVGAFNRAMHNLTNLKLLPVLNKIVLEKQIPLLGICLGMQLLSNSSEEGNVRGLQYIDGEVTKFRFSKDSKLKIPHMGWNTVDFKKKNSLIEDMPAESRFYFVHSYHFKCKDQNNVLTTTNYGYEFASAVVKDNIYGVQFHPEKSHKFGMQLLINFVENI